MEELKINDKDNLFKTEIRTFDNSNGLNSLSNHKRFSVFISFFNEPKEHLKTKIKNCACLSKQISTQYGLEYMLLRQWYSTPNEYVLKIQDKQKTVYLEMKNFRLIDEIEGEEDTKDKKFTIIFLVNPTTKQEINILNNIKKCKVSILS